MDKFNICEYSEQGYCTFYRSLEQQYDKELKSKVQYNIQREKESLFHIESNVSENEDYLNELFSIVDKL